MSYAYNARKKAIKHGERKGGKRNKEYTNTTVETMADGSVKKTVIDEKEMAKAIEEG